MRDRTDSMIVYLHLAPMMPRDPPITFCDTIAGWSNLWSQDEIWITADGVLLRFDPERPGMKECAFCLLDMNGFVPLPWSPAFQNAVLAGYSEYGIDGML